MSAAALTQSEVAVRKWIKILAWDGLILLVILAAIQLIPVDHDPPPTVREPVWDSSDTRDLAVDACFDCHSNQTEWPWYAKIAPSSWVLWYDVTQGREALNFSDWDQHDQPEAAENENFPPKPLAERIEAEIRSGAMPPGLYRLAHPDARLSEAEKDALIEGLKRTVEQNMQP